MAEPINFEDHRKAKASGSYASSLKSGDGDGTSGGMEARIAKLEADMEHVKKGLDRLSDVPATLARLDQRVAGLPDKDWVGAKMRNWVGGAVAFLTLVTIAAKFIHLG